MTAYDCIINGLHFHIYQAENTQTTNVMVDDYESLYNYATYVDTIPFDKIKLVLSKLNSSSDNIGIEGFPNTPDVDSDLGRLRIVKKYEYVVLSFGNENIRIPRNSMTEDPVRVLHRYVLELRNEIVRLKH